MMVSLAKIQCLLAFCLVTTRADLDNVCLMNIGRQIGDDIQSLAIQLGLSNADIENIKQQHVTGNWGFQVLNKWKQRRDKHEDIQQLLAEALRKIERVDLAQQVLDCQSETFSDEGMTGAKRSHIEGNKFPLIAGIVIAGLVLVMVSIAVNLWMRERVGVSRGDSDALDPVLLEKIGKKIGSKVQSLAVHLGQRDNIENIKAGDPHNAGNWGYKILESWQQATEVPNQKEALIKILKDIGRNDLAGEVETYTPS
ncbi:unnamed protein product [Owenia fusiformis]|uniref:Uncharacterized protein n=1 Tax=Owenia fusiformis TaxID=6347 RepID=A0A8J1XFQ6_OWEFU|nr:unnamed protein product [Owenia fusiformis]